MVSDYFASPPVLGADAVELLICLSSYGAGLTAPLAGAEARILAVIGAAGALPTTDVLERAVQFRRGFPSSAAQAESILADLEELERDVLVGLRAVVAQAREQVLGRIARVSRKVPMPTLESLLAPAWGLVEPADMGAALAAREQLEATARSLDEIERDCRSALQVALAAPAPGTPDSLLTSGRNALDGGSTDAIVEALSALERVRRRVDEAGRGTDQALAADGLRAACDRARAALPPETGARDDVRVVLEAVFGGAEAFAAELARGIGGPSSVAAAREWGKALDQALLSAQDLLAREEVELHTAARRLDDTLAGLEGRLTGLPEPQRRAVAASVQKARAGLTAPDAATFDAHVVSAFAALRQAAKAREAEVTSRREELSKRLAQARAALEQSAAAVPADLVAECRLLVAQSDGIDRAGQIETITSLSAELARSTESILRAARERQEDAEGRARIALKRVAEEARALADATGAPFAARAEALADEVKAGKAGSPDEARRKLDALRRDAEFGIRHGARRAADAARRAAKPNTPLGGAVEAVDAALASADLGRVRLAAAALREVRGRRVLVDNPLVKFGIPALLVLAIVGAYALRDRGGPTRFDVKFTASGSKDTVKLTVVGMNNDVEEFAVPPDRGTTVRLPVGRYDIFVADGGNGDALRWARTIFVSKDAEISIPAGP